MTDLYHYNDDYYDTAVAIADSIDEQLSIVGLEEYESSLEVILTAYFKDEQITVAMMRCGFLVGCLNEELEYARNAFADEVAAYVPDGTGYVSAVDDAVFNLTQNIDGQLHPVHRLNSRVAGINSTLYNYRLPWDDNMEISGDLKAKAEDVLVCYMNCEDALAKLVGFVWFGLSKAHKENDVPKINLKITNDNPVVIPTPTHITKPHLKLIN